MITVLVSPEAFGGDEILVEGDAYRHLFRARRLAVGDAVRVTDGEGRARNATIASVDRRRGVLAAGAPAAANEPPYRLHLLVAPPRPERASWLVEKATELGAWSVRFLASERAPRRYGDGTLERLLRVAGAAVEQCHRARRPAVSGIHPWEDLETLLEEAAERFYLDPAAVDRENPRDAQADSGAVIIGPEGGWSPAERIRLEQLAVPVGLGPRILRVETAALAAAARILLPASRLPAVS